MKGTRDWGLGTSPQSLYLSTSPLSNREKDIFAWNFHMHEQFSSFSTKIQAGGF